MASTSDGTTTCTRSYNPANQLTTETCSGSTETFVYDANGNLASDDDYVYHWDFLNRLVHVEAKVGGGTEPLVAFGYDAAGRRITKVFNDNVDLGLLGSQPARSESWFTYSGPNVVQESQPIRWSSDPSGGVLDPSVNVVRQFTYGSGVDEMLEMTVDSNADGDTTDASDERYYYAFDTQGSVIGLIDDNGDLVEGYSYNPHGELTIRVPGSGNDDVKWDANDTIVTGYKYSPAGNPFYYTGQRLDPETQTYHYRARQYDPEMGRFLSRDPIGIWTDDINLGNPYAYVGNRPWQFRDPSGQFTWITAGIGAVVGAAAGAATYVGGAIINDADTSFAGLGKAVGIGAAGGFLIGTGAGFAQGAGLFGTIAGGAVAGAGEGILAGVTVDALDNGAIDEGVGAYAAAAGTGAITGGLIEGGGAVLKGIGPLGKAFGKSADNTWPLNRGFTNDGPAPSSLIPGARIDRYGDEAGKFVSPQGTPFSGRSLPEGHAGRPLRGYEVLEPIDVNAGTTAPWFNQPGGGIQFELPDSVYNLVKQGFLRRV